MIEDLKYPSRNFERFRVANVGSMKIQYLSVNPSDLNPPALRQAFGVSVLEALRSGAPRPAKSHTDSRSRGDHDDGLDGESSRDRIAFTMPQSFEIEAIFVLGTVHGESISDIETSRARGVYAIENLGFAVEHSVFRRGRNSSIS